MSEYFNDLIIDEIDDSNESGVASRWIDTGNATLWESKIIENNFKTSSISIHGVLRDSLTRETKRYQHDNGRRFTVESIKFTDRDGIRHSIDLYS